MKDFSDKEIDVTIKNPEMNNEYTGDNSTLLENYSELQFTRIEEGLRKLYEYKKGKI